MRLAGNVKDRITPLLEIPPIGYDHEQQKASKTINEHLSEFGKRLGQKWGGRRCFVDLQLIGCDTMMAGGQHCVGYVFARARENQCAAVPVIRLSSTTSFVAAVGAVIELDERGVCLRLLLPDFDRPNFAVDIANLLTTLKVDAGETDLIIDFGAHSYQSNTVFNQAVTAMFKMLPNLPHWRTLTIAGTSYPQLVTQVIGSPKDPQLEVSGTINRREWIAYKSLVEHLGTETRIPTFGDYAASHPDIIEMDMRVIKPLAKLRYTIDDAWHIGIGRTIKTHGFGQYQGLCTTLVARPYYSGPMTSAGDNYIYYCSQGTEPTGNLTTWVWVSTNQHLTKVVADLSNLSVPSK